MVKLFGKEVNLHPLWVTISLMPTLWITLPNHAVLLSREGNPQKIRELIQGNAGPGKQANDAFHLVESAKNGGRHFITNDGRLLKKAAPEIWKALMTRVLTASEFINDYYSTTDQNGGTRVKS